MDRAWMQQKLTEFRDLANEYLRTPRVTGSLFAAAVNKDRPRPDNEDRAELRRREPTVKEILKRLDPELANFNVDGMGGDKDARDAADRGLGILAERDEWAGKLAPDAPALPADQFHPWVWQAAQTLWDSGHYRLAVQAGRHRDQCSHPGQTQPARRCRRQPHAGSIQHEPASSRQTPVALPRRSQQSDRAKPPARRAPVRRWVLPGHPQPRHS